jgi:DNA-directed RNA polymerase subunit RPC12/RpoP
MRFVCDRCGKKYATAGDPAPGKVYKLKCKACGHLIVVKGQVGTVTGVPAITAAEAATASPMPEPEQTPVQAAPPEIELHVEPEPHASPAAADRFAGAEQQPEPVSDDAIEPLPPAPFDESSPLPREVAMAADSAAAASGLDPPTPPFPAPGLFESSPAMMDPALTPPPPEKDELADFAAAAADVMAGPGVGTTGESEIRGYVDLFADAAPREPASDPFAAAARSSLPDNWAGPTPFAAPVSPPAPRLVAPAPPRIKPQKSALGGLPMAIVGLGMLSLIGITAYALLGHGGSAPPVAVAPEPEPGSAPPKAAEPAVKVPTPTPTPEPVAEKKTEPAPETRVAEQKPEPKARPPERKPEKKPEPKVAEKKPEPPRPPAQPVAPPVVVVAAAEPVAEVPDAAAALTQDVVNRVVGANRKAFSSCIASAGGTDVKLDGRRVALRITVNTNGTVTYPTLDDQSLNATEMGQCLKSAARLMIFPKFKGDPFHYEVPLILTSN